MTPSKKTRRIRLTGEQLEANEAIELAQQRLAEKKAAAALAKRKKATPRHKTMHAVENEDVHSGNSTARQVDSRSEIDRDSEQVRPWTRSSQLSAPAPRPGMKQKWVRFRNGKEEDTDNLDRYLDEGWSPRKAESVRRGHELTSSSQGKYAQYIVKRGLILMEIPEEMAAQRNRAYRRKADRMTEGVDRNMFKINNRVMPVLEPVRRTRVDKNVRRGARLDDRMPADE